MRDYALIWNTRIERYEWYDLNDNKRRRNKLGEILPATLKGIMENDIQEALSRGVETASDRLTADWAEQKKAPPKRG